MKAVLIVLLLSISALSEPVSCYLLEKGRFITGKNCKCAMREYDDGKSRAVVNYCGGNLASIVMEVNYDDQWYRFTGTLCERLDDVKKWSCKTYDFSKENYKKKATVKTISFSEFRNGTDDLLDPGDMEYLGLKLKY